MRTHCIWRTLLSLVLGLLFLSVAAMGGCSGDYQALLGQLQQQMALMQDTSTLLDPFMRLEGLDKLRFSEHCTERPGAFPSDNALRTLGRRDFLRMLSSTLQRVLHRLAVLQQHLPETQDLEELGVARWNILGLKNNIYCMSQLLGGASELAPTTAAPGTSPPPTPAPDAFQSKLQGCRFLHGYHRFLHSARRVFSQWGSSPSRRRRQSPVWPQLDLERKHRPSRRGKRLVFRVRLTR
ncbi:oncostatin-M [Tupaia chinensis]|nr:oncostatin-M [Tupaia chinensis]